MSLPPDFPDYTKRFQGKVDHWYIKSVELKDPTVEKSIPISIENPAIAYDSATDRFKIKVEEWTAGALDVNITEDITRLLGKIDLAYYAGSLVGPSNPLDVQIIVGGSAIDPRDRNWTITETITVQATDLDIRDLTQTDEITVFQTNPANLKATVTQAEKDRTITDITKTATRKAFDITFTGAADTAIWTPASGKKIRLKFIQFSTDADVEVGLRFGTTETKWAVLQEKGVLALNLIGCNIEGDVDQELNVRAEGAVTVKGFVLGEEI